jgi:hypothetical protein
MYCAAAFSVVKGSVLGLKAAAGQVGWARQGGCQLAPAAVVGVAPPAGHVLLVVVVVHLVDLTFHHWQKQHRSAATLAAAAAPSSPYCSHG